MNGLRPKELLEVLRELEEAAARERGPVPVLATVVSLGGSVYRRAGAMALMVGDCESRPGVIALEDLEGELRNQALETGREGRARLAALDIRDDNAILGYGFGAPGRLEMLLEPVDGVLRGHMRSVREALLRREGFVSAVEIEGERVGRRVLYPCEHPDARECYAELGPQLVESVREGKTSRAFLCPVAPMGRVLLFGSGQGTLSLARHLAELGFSVAAADPRPGRLENPAWKSAGAELIAGGWEQARAADSPDEGTAIVVMTHSYALDLETLQGALLSPASYVGVVGPAARTQRLLADLEKLEVRPRPGVFFGPAGLDIGAETPAEAALSVAAEILAARSGLRKGRQAPRKASPGPPARHKLPGLVLAAGRGRRFAGGHKLSASIDGRPVLRHAVENALASRLDPVIVVLGCDAEAGLKALHGLEDPRLRVVFNPLWEGGKASSIEAGLREAPAGAPGVVSLLGDMPRVQPWLIDRVISEFELSGRLTFPVFPGPDGPRKGYPTAFPRALFGEIKALTGDDTAMEAVRRHWSEAVRIPLESGDTQADVDTAEDLQLLLGAGQP